ncbi:MAG: hypothetical protein ABI231_03910 [Candidatus Tumulicola sp.]
MTGANGVGYGQNAPPYGSGYPGAYPAGYGSYPGGYNGYPSGYNNGYNGTGYNNGYYGNGYNNGYNNGYYGNGYNNGYYGNTPSYPVPPAPLPRSGNGGRHAPPPVMNPDPGPRRTGPGHPPSTAAVSGPIRAHSPSGERAQPQQQREKHQRPPALR